MKPKIILSVLVLLTVHCLLTTVHCLSAVPSLINYQGVLKDSTGVPQNGSFPMRFSIYDDSIGGNKLWEEIHMAVEVKNGLFNVLLGSSSGKGPIPDSVFASPNTWLEVQVSASVLTPRRRIVSVGYALHSEITDTAEYARFAPDKDWQIDTSGFNIFRMTGNVGIGTFPQEKLDVNGNAHITGDLTVDGSINPFPLRVYDSGWFSASPNANYTKTHNLGTTNLIIMLYYSSSSDGSNPIVQSIGNQRVNTDMNKILLSPNIYNITSAQLTVGTGNEILAIGNHNASGGGEVSSGYLRVVALALE
jgi:hypothetical protein